MKNSIKLSYAIPVCNEADELIRLLDLLIEHKQEQDEIIVVTDADSATPEVLSIIEDYEIIEGTDNIKVFRNSLNGNFAQHKNYLNSKCTGDWIVQLDADEYITETLLANIHTILESNTDVDAIWLPRVNTVEGLTQIDITKWGWNVNGEGHVNWPDFQCRLYKNKPEIKWKNKVHEQLTGYEASSNFPLIEAFAIQHPKTIDRQRKQNDFYETL